MILKNFDDISIDDVLSLIANEVPESRTLDYKESLPENLQQAEAKKEFLADIVSFANAAGGDLVFGVKEKRDDKNKGTGIPEAISGVTESNFDNLILRIQNMIRDSIQPRIVGVHIKPVRDSSGKDVLILRVPKSWQAPHMSLADNRFYTRTSAGKHPLDVSEIRAAFDQSRDLSNSVRAFRIDRINKILSGETPVPLEGESRVVLHILPLASFSRSVDLDVRSIKEKMYNMPHLSGPGGYSVRYNFDGLLNYSSRYDDRSRSYVQLFRNGIIEAVDTWLVVHPRGDAQGARPLVAQVHEREITKSLKPYVRFLADLGVLPPMIVVITLIGLRGGIMAVDTWRYDFDQHAITEDVLQLPELVIDDLDFEAGPLLKPIFDTVWQAAGWPHSVNFDHDGKWIGKV